MVEPWETRNNGEAYQMVRYQSYNNHHNSRIPSSSTSSLSSPMLDLRVFYVRISNIKVDESTPEILTITHIPLDPDSLLEINCVRNSQGVSSQLRRDSVDKRSEAATFISTDNIRLSGGGVKFEVYDREDLVLSGTLEMSGSKWNMNCEAEISSWCGFLKDKSSPSPTVEVYVTGCFSGTPIIMTKTLQLEYDACETRKGNSSEVATENGGYKEDYEGEYNDMYVRGEYEDGEMSWFNAGVRVGVGKGLGVCVGLGIGVGLVVRTYQSATRNFRRRLI